MEKQLTEEQMIMRAPSEEVNTWAAVAIFGWEPIEPRYTYWGTVRFKTPDGLAVWAVPDYVSNAWPTDELHGRMRELGLMRKYSEALWELAGDDVDRVSWQEWWGMLNASNRTRLLAAHVALFNAGKADD